MCWALRWGGAMYWELAAYGLIFPLVAGEKATSDFPFSWRRLSRDMNVVWSSYELQVFIVAAEN